MAKTQVVKVRLSKKDRRLLKQILNELKYHSELMEDEDLNSETDEIISPPPTTTVTIPGAQTKTWAAPGGIVQWRGGYWDSKSGQIIPLKEDEHIVSYNDLRTRAGFEAVHPWERTHIRDMKEHPTMYSWFNEAQDKILNFRVVEKVELDQIEYLLSPTELRIRRK